MIEKFLAILSLQCNCFLTPFFCLYFLTGNVFLINRKEISEIDKNLKLSEYYYRVDNIKSLQFAKKACIISEKINNSEKKAYSYLYIAKILCFYDPKASLNYIEKAQNLDYTKNNLLMKASLKKVKRYNYSILGLGDRVLKENFEIIKLLKNEKSTEALKILVGTYSSLGENYYYLSKPDSAFIYLNKGEEILKKNKKDKFIKEIADFYCMKGTVFLQIKKNDSALYCFQKGYDLIQKDRNISQAYFYNGFGEYYNSIKNYHKAKEYYLKSISDFESHHIDDIYMKRELYEKIVKICVLLNLPKESEKFQRRYNEYNDMIVKKNKDNTLEIINYILAEKEKKVSAQRTINNLYILLIFIPIAIFLVVLLTQYRRSSTKKKQALEKAEQQLIEKEIVISTKELETEELQRKLQESLDEVIELAKRNNSLFFVRFQELYPDFQTKLLAINQQIQLSELILLAYVFLNFSTKEIAEYTFRSVRTVQTRKYNIRKKLNLSTSDDLYIWLKNLY